MSACETQKTQRLVKLEVSIELTALPKSGPLELWLPLPRSSEIQKVSKLEVRSPHPWEKRREPIYGNEMLYIKLDAAPAELRFDYSAELRRSASDSPSSEDYGAGARSLAPTQLIPLDERTRRLSVEAIGKAQGPVAQARAIYENCLERMSYDKSGEGWGRGDFAYACEIGKGNCTDFHSYFLGLARAAGIASDFEIGFWIPKERGQGKAPGYHCWAWYKSPEGWRSVDISEADKDPSRKDYFFGCLCENRIALSRGRDLILEPPQKGPPINFFFQPYCEVDGREAGKARLTVQYTDLQLQSQRAS